MYAGAKAGQIAFGKTLAREVARHGVTVNSVCPGPTETPLLDGMLGAGEASAKMVAALRRAVPMGRLDSLRTWPPRWRFWPRGRGLHHGADAVGQRRADDGLRRMERRMDLTDTRYQVENGLAWVTIDRPDRMNAFRARTVDELIHLFTRAWASPRWA